MPIRTPSSSSIRICALAAALAGAIASPAPAQMRIVNYNIAQLNGNNNNLRDVLTAIIEDDKPGFAVAPMLFIFQEVQTGDVAPLQDLLNEAIAPTGFYALGTYTNHNEDGVAGAQAMFYLAGALEEDASAHLDIATGAGRETDRWKLQLVGYDSPDAAFYIYSSHLKASTGPSNEQQRLAGVVAIRNNADALPAGCHVVYGGDMNFYSNAEPGYQHFISAGPARAIDPLGYGSWGGASNAIKHSQSPRLISNGLVGGGLDDRFDFQFSTEAVHDGEGVALIADTYRSLGNDGQHYDIAINTGDNFYYPMQVPRSNALADDLHEASDHVPVVVDYQVPAVMFAAMSPDFGRVIRDTPYAVTLVVMNTASVTVAAGADELDYEATASGDLSGTASGTAEPLGPASNADFDVDTSAAGAVSGSVTVYSGSQGAQNPIIVLDTLGMVVRPANASFSDVDDVDEQMIEWALAPDTGVHETDVPVYNYQFDALQATLDVDDVDGPIAPLAFISGLASGVGPDPAQLTFAFDTTGVAPGQYESNIEITTSDEDIPGETQATLLLNLVVTVQNIGPIPGDVNGDGVVDVQDLLALFSAWGPCPSPPDPCPADINADGTVDVQDLLTLFSNWT